MTIACSLHRCILQTALFPAAAACPKDKLPMSGCCSTANHHCCCWHARIAAIMQAGCAGRVRATPCLVAGRLHSHQKGCVTTAIRMSSGDSSSSSGASTMPNTTRISSSGIPASQAQKRSSTAACGCYGITQPLRRMDNRTLHRTCCAMNTFISWVQYTDHDMI